MKGRETLSDLQAFLEKVIIQCFTAKYSLLMKRREAVPAMQIDLWNLFKSQEGYFRGKIIDFNSINISNQLQILLWFYCREIHNTR